MSSAKMLQALLSLALFQTASDITAIYTLFSLPTGVLVMQVQVANHNSEHQDHLLKFKHSIRMSKKWD